MSTPTPTPDDIARICGDPAAIRRARAVLARFGALGRWADDIHAAGNIVAETLGLPEPIARVLTAHLAIDGMSVVRDTFAGEAKAGGYSTAAIGSVVLPGKSTSNTYRAMPYMRDAAAAVAAATEYGSARVVDLGPWEVRVRPLRTEADDVADEVTDEG